MDLRLLQGIFFTLVLIQSAVAKSRVRYRKPIVNYPKDTLFKATDFFVHGCNNFIFKCPVAYKLQFICARSYSGDFKDFNNYCEMQFENCNTWKNWVIYKRTKC